MTTLLVARLVGILAWQCCQPLYLQYKELLTVISTQAFGVAIVMVGRLARGIRRMVVIVATCCRDMRAEQIYTNSTKAALER